MLDHSRGQHAATTGEARYQVSPQRTHLV